MSTSAAVGFGTASPIQRPQFKGSSGIAEHTAGDAPVAVQTESRGETIGATSTTAAAEKSSPSRLRGAATAFMLGLTMLGGAGAALTVSTPAMAHDHGPVRHEQHFDNRGGRDIREFHRDGWEHPRWILGTGDYVAPGCDGQEHLMNNGWVIDGEYSPAPYHLGYVNGTCQAW